MIVFAALLISLTSCTQEQANTASPEMTTSQEQTSPPGEVSRFKASHILVKSREEAEEIKKEIDAGEKDFAKAAKDASLCPSGASGGDLGYFTKGDMVPEFEQAVIDLPVGQVSEPVQTQFGWHLILVTDKK